MGLRINTNVASLIGQRNVERTDRALTRSLERLSSGLRINSAADDPAGLAIAEKQRAQIAGLNKAIQNAERATSMAQTGESALQEVNSLLVHMRELIVDSANTGYNDANAIAANQAEIDNALASLDRIADTTAFGGKKLLDGSAANQVLFADGANDTLYATLGTSTLATGTRSLKVYDVTDASWAPESATLLTNMGFTNNLTGEQQDVSGLAAGAHLVRVTQASTASSISGAVTAKDLSVVNEEFRLRVYDGSANVTSADLVLNADYDPLTLATLVTDINTLIAADPTVAGKVEAYANGSELAFRTTSEGSSAYVEILDPSGGPATSALGAGNILSGYASGDDSVADGTVGTDAIVYLDSYANAVSFIEGDTAATKTVATLLDAASGGGSLKVQAGNSGLSIGNAVLNVTAASGKAKLFDLAGAGGSSGDAAEWTAGQAFVVEDSDGKALRVTIGNAIRLDGAGAGEATEDLTIQDNSLVFQVGGERGQTVSLSLLNAASRELATGLSNASGFASLGEIRVANAQQCGDALLLVDDAISQVSSVRAEIGSFQLNTLESQLNNLRVASENLTAARSTVVDTNFAATVSEFSKQQILLQSGIAVLASAGQMPQMILSLLRS